MTVSAEFADFLKEQMTGLGTVGLRRMFGGMGVFRDGLMFALVDDDVLYLKVDEPGRAAFEAEGLTPFTYATKNGAHTLTSYWRAPERCLDDADEMTAWGRRAVEVALKAAKPLKKKR
jgi:DNA transformation protein and related proteins